MKIALICTEKLPVPPVAGGAVQLYIDGIIPYVAKQHELTVFCVQHPALPNEEIIKGVKYVRVPAPNKASYLSNVKSALSNNYDLVFVFNRPLWVLSLAKSFPDVRFGLSLHNEMFHPEKISEAQGIDCVQRVDTINTVSSFIANGVSARFSEAASKLNVIYSGVDITKYVPVWTAEGLHNKQRIKEKLGIPNYRVVLFVGRLSNKKGVDVLIKAMQRVMESHKDVALAVIGSKWFGKNESDEYTASLKKLATTLKGPVVFTGFLPPSEIPPYYNMGDIFICPSQWSEPLARVHYEAMAAGLPIITTNRGGNAEIIEDEGNGLILNDIDGIRNCHSPEYMAEHIEYLLDNPKFASKMGKIGRTLAEEKYNWPRVSRDFLTSLSKVQLLSGQIKPKNTYIPKSLNKEKITENKPEKKVKNKKVYGEDFFSFDI